MTRTNYLPEGPSFQPLASLTIAEWNPRLIREKKFQKLIKSIKDDPGFLVERSPLVADGPKHQAGGVVYAGNRRDQALGYLFEHGWEPPDEWQAKGWLKGYTPVSVRDIPKRIAQKRAIQDNNHEGEWVEQDLAELLVELDSENVDLTLLGFDDKDLDALLELVGAKGDTGLDTDPGPGDLPDQAITKPGDIWILGSHRLMCGDATSSEDVARLMDGDKANLGLCDPPYNVGEDYANDADLKTTDEYAAFSKGWFNALCGVTERQIVTPGHANLAAWCRFFDPQFVAPWTKTNSMTRGRVSRFTCWEPIMFFGQHWKRERANEVFDFPITEQKAEGVGSLTHLHPCPKPLSFWLDLVSSYSDKAQKVVDLFGGTGTTIIACAQLDRVCYSMESDPKYCDLIVARWQGMTGQDAQRMVEAVAA